MNDAKIVIADCLHNYALSTVGASRVVKGRALGGNQRGIFRVVKGQNRVTPPKNLLTEALGFTSSIRSPLSLTD